MKSKMMIRGTVMAAIAVALAMPAYAQEKPAPKPLPKCTDKKKTDCEVSPNHPKDPTVQP